MRLDKKMKSKVYRFSLHSIVTKSLLFKSAFTSYISDVDLSYLYVPKIKVVNLPNNTLQNNLVLTLIMPNDSNIVGLALEELIFKISIIDYENLPYNTESLNKILIRDGFKIEENIDFECLRNLDLSKLLIEELKDEILNNTEDINLSEEKEILKTLVESFVKYIVYVCTNIGIENDVEIDHLKSIKRINLYYSLVNLNLDKDANVLQEIIDELCIEFIDYPFIYQLISEIIIQIPETDKSLNYTIINDPKALRFNDMVCNIYDYSLIMEDFSFSDIYEDTYLRCNRLTTQNFFVNLDTFYEVIDKDESIHSNILMNNASTYSKLFTILDNTGGKSPQLTNVKFKNDNIVPDSKIIFREMLNSRLSEQYISEASYLDYKDNLDNMENHNYESDTNKLEWNVDSETTEIEKNKTEEETNEKMASQNAINNPDLYPKDLREQWYFRLQNTIPSYETDKNEIEFKKYYKEVSINKLSDRMKETIKLYGDYLQLSDYLLNIDKVQDLYGVYSKIGGYYSKVLGKENIKFSRGNIDNMFMLIDKETDAFEDIITEYENVLEDEESIKEYLPLNPVDVESFYRNLPYMEYYEYKDELFKFALGHYEETKLWTAFEKTALILNQYQGNDLIIDEQTLPKEVVYILHMRNVRNYINECKSKIDSKLIVWCNAYLEYVNNNENNIKTEEEYDLKLIKKFVKLIEKR